MAKTYSKTDDRTLKVSENVQVVEQSETYSLAQIEAKITALEDELAEWETLLSEATKLSLKY